MPRSKATTQSKPHPTTPSEKNSSRKKNYTTRHIPTEFGSVTAESATSPQAHVFSKRGTASLKPFELVLAFGLPSPADGCKVSGEFYFRHRSSGTVLTVYDWKRTSLMYPEGRLVPTPSRFWSNDASTVDFSIGGSDSAHVSEFAAWIQNETRRRVNAFNNKGRRVNSK
jgi:hypothetical protein